MSYYAFFKGWLLLSQPPRCLNRPTTFPTERPLRDLRWRSWVLPLSSSEAWTSRTDCSVRSCGIRSLVGRCRLSPSTSIQSLYPRRETRHASPKAISRRTSYRRVRLEFLRYPQLIPEFCTAHGFGPPPAFRRDSTWSWVDHPASGLVNGMFIERDAARLAAGYISNYSTRF